MDMSVFPVGTGQGLPGELPAGCQCPEKARCSMCHPPGAIQGASVPVGPRSSPDPRASPPLGCRHPLRPPEQTAPHLVTPTCRDSVSHMLPARKKTETRSDGGCRGRVLPSQAGRGRAEPVHITPGTLARVPKKGQAPRGKSPLQAERDVPTTGPLASLGPALPKGSSRLPGGCQLGGQHWKPHPDGWPGPPSRCPPQCGTWRQRQGMLTGL